MRLLACAAVIAVWGGLAAPAWAEEDGARWVSAASQHDGQHPWRYGWLKAVAAPGPSGGEFALLDRHGNVRCYVTPDGSVDANAYTGEHVRLQGPVMAKSADGVPLIHARQIRALVSSGTEVKAIERPPRAKSSTGFRLVTAEEPAEPRRFVVPATAQELQPGPELTAPRPFVAASQATPASGAAPPRELQPRARLPRPAVASGHSSRWEPVRRVKQEEVPAGPAQPERALSPIPEGALEVPADEQEVFDVPYGEEPLYDGAPVVGWGAMNPFPRRFWVRAEYLLWETEGMNVPALVTTSPTGTPRADAGVLGEPSTSILYGDDEILDDSRSGGRIRFGTWLDERARIGLQGEFFVLADENETFAQSSDGTPILARPFFDVLQGVESAELLAFPNVVSGAVAVDSTTSLIGAGGLAQFNVVCRPKSWQSPYHPHICQGGVRVAALAGYRFLRLDDSLSIREDLTSLDTQNPGTFAIRDSFETRNNFHGVDLGMLIEWRRCRWSLELLTRVALGNNQEIVTIDGSSAITEGGVTENFTGGILAQRSNIGEYKRNQFAVVPELGVTLGYQLTPNWRATVGYSFLYWSRVVRAGDQIDLDVNTNLIPPEVQPFAGPLRPRALLTETDFWAQGLNAGVECQW